MDAGVQARQVDPRHVAVAGPGHGSSADQGDAERDGDNESQGHRRVLQFVNLKGSI
jgi:hypothetical protein